MTLHTTFMLTLMFDKGTSTILELELRSWVGKIGVGIGLLAFSRGWQHYISFHMYFSKSIVDT